MVPTAPHTLGIPEACRGLFGKCHVVTQNFGTFCSEICNSICHAVVYFHYSKNLCTASSTEPSSAPSQEMGCPRGTQHHQPSHPMLPAIPLPGPAIGKQWDVHWATPKYRLGDTAVRASINDSIDWHDAMVGDVKCTWKITNVLGPLCWQAQIFFSAVVIIIIMII